MPKFCVSSENMFEIGKSPTRGDMADVRDIMGTDALLSASIVKASEAAITLQSKAVSSILPC